MKKAMSKRQKPRDADICLFCPLRECRGGREGPELRTLKAAPRDCLRDFAFWHHKYNGVRMKRANEFAKMVYDWPRPPRTARPFFRAIEQEAERQELLNKCQLT